MSAAILPFPVRDRRFTLIERAAIAAWSAATGWRAELRAGPRGAEHLRLAAPGVDRPLLGVQRAGDGCELFVLDSERVLGEYASLPEALRAVAPG